MAATTSTSASGSIVIPVVVMGTPLVVVDTALPHLTLLGTGQQVWQDVQSLLVLFESALLGLDVCAIAILTQCHNTCIHLTLT